MRLNSFLEDLSKPETFETLLQLHKEQKKDVGPDYEAREFVKENLNKKCKIKFAGHIGIIHSLNTKRGGFYPGVDFPVNVKITESDIPEAINRIFEYSLNQIELI